MAARAHAMHSYHYAVILSFPVNFTCTAQLQRPLLAVHFSLSLIQIFSSAGITRSILHQMGQAFYSAVRAVIKVCLAFIYGGKALAGQARKGILDGNAGIRHVFGPLKGNKKKRSRTKQHSGWPADDTSRRHLSTADGTATALSKSNADK